MNVIVSNLDCNGCDTFDFFVMQIIENLLHMNNTVCCWYSKLSDETLIVIPIIYINSQVCISLKFKFLKFLTACFEIIAFQFYRSGFSSQINFETL